jgi:type II secretory pathway component PulC
MSAILRTALLSSAAATVLCTAAVFAADTPKGSIPAATAPSRQNDRERYSVLTDQNIFLKDRRSRRTATTSSERPPMTDLQRLRETPEASFVLTGVVFEDGDYRAFIEDAKAGKVLRLSVGEPVARGKLTQIDIDTVAYESSGKTTVINVGTTLTGVPYSAFTSAPGATPAPGAAPSSPLPDPNNPNLTIEERMKLRRAAELQKK